MRAVRTEPFKSRFQVIDSITRQIIPDAFILFPVSDPKAILAMKAYLATLPGNDPDWQALADWVERLESTQKEFREMEKY